MAFGLFLKGLDSIDDVRQIRSDAISALASGTVIEFHHDNTSTRKSGGMDLKLLVRECNQFLRLYDADIRKDNPIITVSKPNLIFP